MIVGEYEQKAVCKCYNVVDNGPDSVLPVRFIVLISKYNGVSDDRNKPYFVCTQSGNAGDRHP